LIALPSRRQRGHNLDGMKKRKLVVEGKKELAIGQAEAKIGYVIG
jgi:hypothetical protein